MAAAAAVGGSGGGAALPAEYTLAFTDIKWDKDDDDEKVALGRGAFGTVYAGRLHGQQVAIKHEVIDDPEVAEIWTKTAVLHMRAKCPHIVAMHGAVVRTPTAADGVTAYYTIMERLAGTLTKLLLTPGGAHYGANMSLRLQLLADVASGLAYLHAASVIHGDVKPDNILLTVSSSRTPQPTAKLADFGSSVQRRMGTKTHTTLRAERGTLLYMDPGLLEGSTSITAGSDVYSFGVMAWQVLSGCVPFAAECEAASTALDAEKLLKAHVCGPRGKRPPVAALVERGVPPAVVALVQSCWAPDQTARPTMAAVHHTLEAATAAAAAVSGASGDDAIGGGAVLVPQARGWPRAASVAAAAAFAAAAATAAVAAAAPPAAVAVAEPPVPLPAAANLIWHNGANFFADYKLTRERVDAITDQLDMYGQGAFGVVLGCELVAAADPPPPPLAVKRISVDTARMRVASAEDLFQREVVMPRRAAEILDEVGLVHLLLYIIDGYMSTDPYTGAVTIYVVMERMPDAVPAPLLVPAGGAEPPAGRPAVTACGSGVDLFDHTPMSPFAARMVVKQMLTVEAALHARHIIHRDIKLDNVLVAGWEGEGARRYPRIKLADFSLMRVTNDGEVLTSSAGSRDYQPPEQLRPHPVSREFEYDGRVDVFATGLLWYMAVTGMSAVADAVLLPKYHNDVARGDTEEEARRYFRERFPLAARYFSKRDGTLNDDGTLLWFMTLRWGNQRLTAEQCLAYPAMAGGSCAARSSAFMLTCFLLPRPACQWPATSD